MGKKLLRAGKVVVVLSGRFAGKKAIIVKSFDEGHGDRKFGHCIVAGLERGPKKVTKSMSDKKIKQRSHALKPFVRFINNNHILPTRYQVDFDLKKVAVRGSKEGEQLNVDESTLKDKAQKDLVTKGIKKVLKDGFDQFEAKKDSKGKVGEHYFYSRLRF